MSSYQKIYECFVGGGDNLSRYVSLAPSACITCEHWIVGCAVHWELIAALWPIIVHWGEGGYHNKLGRYHDL